MKEISGNTRLFGILADPIYHVKTPQRLNEHFARIGFDGVCVPLHARPDNLAAVVAGLRALGGTIHSSHEASNLDGVDTVVYSSAIPQDHLEMVEARRRGLRVLHRSEALAAAMTGRRTVAVAGTHGKTTTTSMVSLIMLEAGLDPTIHIGGELEAIGGTTRIGGGRFFIAEACEYTGSFLKFHPYLAVLLNMEFDHADYFRDMDHIKETFVKFASLVPKDGYIVACADDAGVMSVLDMTDCNKVTYGIKTAGCTWSASDITYDDLGCAGYRLMHNNEAVAEIKLGVPGIQNVSNSIAAIAACSIMGCSIETAREALRKFTGTHRRFEFKGSAGGIKVIDDYAHHPTEVRVTLRAARNCEQTRVLCIFQPHTYTRTKFLMEDFAVAFDDADLVLLADIYAAREPDTGEVHSGMLADRINGHGGKAIHMKNFDAIVGYLKEVARPGDLIITMGAGDIYKVGEMFLRGRAV